MGHSSPPHRRQSGDQSPPKNVHRGISNELPRRTPSNLQLSPERESRPSRRGTVIDEDDLDFAYGGEPISAHSSAWDTQYFTESDYVRNASSRTLSTPSDNYTPWENTSNIPNFTEGVENDGKRAEEVEEAGLSWTVTLPTDSEQSMLYTNLTESNSIWKAEKKYDKKIGTTTLQSVYSIKYSIGEMGQGKVTLFCPQGPIKDDEDPTLVQARWLHVERSSMSIKVLEKLVMDCPLINGDIRRVAILLLEAVENSFLRESENGAYIEPGSILRFTGTRPLLHGSHNFVVTDPVVFVAFPFVELASKNTHGSRDRDEYFPRTLLQNLYGFDVVTGRGKHQVIHKMSAGSEPNNTLFVNQLWCLIIGSDILITMSDRPADDLLGDTIEKRTDFFRQPLRIEIVDRNGSQHSMSISSKTPWVDFFRHVMFTVHGNLISIMDYELVDQGNEVVTAERWVKIAKSSRSSLLRFHLVERRITSSRASSVSSRRSSHLGIKRSLLLDYAHRDRHHDTKHNRARLHEDPYDGDSSLSERRVGLKKASTPGRVLSQQYSRFSIDTQWFRRPTESEERPSGTQGDTYSEADAPRLYPQSTATITSLDSSDENYSENNGITPPLRDSQDVHEDDRVRYSDVTKPEDLPQLPLSGGGVVNIRYDYSSIEEQQPPASDIEGKREKATRFEDSFSYLNDDDDQITSKEEATDVPVANDVTIAEAVASSLSNPGISTGDDAWIELRDSSESQVKIPATAYKKVKIEDGPDFSDEDDTPRRTYEGPTFGTSPGDIIEVDLDDDLVLEGKVNNTYLAILPEYGNRENIPEKRFTLPKDTRFRREYLHERIRSRSRSLSSSTNDSFYSRGRSPSRNRRAWITRSPDSARDSSSRREVRFHPQQQYSSDKDNSESSIYGSSNATKVETLPVQTIVPFFFWKQNSVASAFTSHDTAEQILIKLLDQIDDLISDDPIGRYYSKVPELTMDDVLLRQESLHGAVVEEESITGPHKADQVHKFGTQGTNNSGSTIASTIGSPQNQAKAMKTGTEKNSVVESTKGLSTNLDPTTKAKSPAADTKPILDDLPNPTKSPPSRYPHDEIYFNQTQDLGLISHDKALAKQLVEMSQQIIWSFVPNTGGAVIHTLMKRLWGCVDIMCLQLLWEESQRGQDSECTYIIRNFSSQVKKADLRRGKPTSRKIHYLDCGDCKAAKPHPSAIEALDHLHEKHIDCPHSESERPYDDPCYVWLHRIWHDGYPMRNSRDGLLGIMEDFIEELSDISNYVRELHDMTARDPSTGDAVSTPPLSANITHTFQQIVKIFIFRSKQLSLINRRRSLVIGSSLENVPQMQRIDRKIEELISLEMDANERIIDFLESAKKDIFLSGIGSHSEMLQAETVRVQFLALAFMSGIQKPLLQPSFIGRSYVKDTLLQLYKDYTSRLHFQANNRPRKRVFLDIHGLEEELQALDKLVDSQESCLYNVLTLIDPLTSRYTTETRFREFRAEVQYGNAQLHQLIERRREIDNLATRLWILKDQVKQTIEIMEEDHGKAIRVFTVVTLFFLPLSFVSSFMGMNTVDVRDTEYSQKIFWTTGIPLTAAVLSLAFIYGYKGEELRDWMIHVSRGRTHQYSSSAFYEMNRDPAYRTSLEARWKEWNPATTAKQTAGERRDFRTLIRSKIKRDTSDQHRSINDSFKGLNVSDGAFSIRRRNTEDSLAPMRRS
ncbi:hypothetical protein V8C42DRAFT_312299 [Trichoderma barbatum]